MNILAALFLVCLLILTVAYFFKYFNGTNLGGKILRPQINILQAKYLDNKNKVIELEHENKRYLILVGSSNILLDSWHITSATNIHDES